MPSRGRAVNRGEDENDAGQQNPRPRSSSQHASAPQPISATVAAAAAAGGGGGGRSGNKRPRRNRSAPPSSISVPTAASSQHDDRALMFKLAEACQKHGSLHLRSENPADEIPQKCAQDLKTIKIVLPKVERAYSSKKEPEADNVAHLCVFYRDVLASGYCPCAPQIFQNEESRQPDGHEVLSRVHYLYQHLAAPAFIANTKLGKDKDETSSANNANNASTPLLNNNVTKACHKPAATTWYLEKTIAHLLSFLEDGGQYFATIQLDLIQLLVDLAVLAQCDDNLLLSSSIQLEIFPKLFTELGHDEKDEYVLDIHHRDSIWSLQSATLNVLIRWCELLCEKSFEPNNLSDDSESNPRDTTAAMQQAFFGSSRRDLLASLRSILLSDSVSVLAERSRSAALELLVHSGLILPRLHTTDSIGWSTEDGAELDLLQEVGLLVVQAIGGILRRLQQWNHYATRQQQTTQSEDVLTNATLLLRHCALFPPRVRGYRSEEVQALMFQAVLHPLLVMCLPWIRPREQRASKEVRQLQMMVLRTIHTCLLKSEKHTAVLPNPVQAVGSLLELIKDSELSKISVWILAALLRPMSLKADDLCASIWSQRHSTPRQFWSAQIPPQPRDYIPREKVDTSLSTKPLSPTANSNTGTKSKRKGSLLGSSPLVIRSPVAKKRKHGDSQLFEPYSAQTSRDVAIRNETAFEPCFVDDLLRTFFVLSLQASQRISEYAMSCASGRIEDPGPRQKDVVFVSGSLKLLLCLLQDRCASLTTHSGQPGIINVGTENATLERLATSWQEWCYSIAVVADKGISSFTKEWQALASVVIDCGLHAWYAANTIQLRLSPPLLEVFRSGCTACCNALGLVAPAVQEDQVEKEASTLNDQMVCHGVCKDVNEVLAFQSWDDSSAFIGSSSCLCSLLSDEAGSTFLEQSSHQRSDCAMMMLSSFPLAHRCCLLACLTQSSQEAPQDVSTWLSTQSSGSLFRRLFQQKPLVWSEMALAMINLSPMMLLACCLSPHEEDPTHVDCNSQDLLLIANNFLNDVLLPAVQTVSVMDSRGNKSKSRAIQSIFVAIRRFQRLHSALGEPNNGQTLASLKRAFNDASTCVSFLCCPSVTVFDNGALVSRDPRGIVGDELRRDITFRLANSSDAMPPSVRLLRWRCAAWEFSRMQNACSLKQHIWLVRTPFSDPDSAVREATSGELGRVLLSNNCRGLVALFAEGNDDWGICFTDSSDHFPGCPSAEEAFFLTNNDDGGARQRRRAASDRIVASLFEEVDGLIVSHCEPPAEIQSTSEGKTEASLSEPSKQSRDRFRSRQISAVKVLSSFCQHADPTTTHGKNIVGQSLLRLVRLLTTVSGDESSSQLYWEIFLRNESTPGASFGALTRLFRSCNLEALLRENRLPGFLAGLVRDVFFPNVGVVSRLGEQQGIEGLSPAVREHRYLRLYSVIQAILASSVGTKITVKDIHEVAKFVDHVLPYILSDFVVKKDYDCLRLMAGFVLFLQGIKKHEERAAKKREEKDVDGESSWEGLESLIGNPTALTKSRAAGVNTSTADLEYQTKLLCLGPKTVERMIPLIFMKSDRTQLTFYTTVVLQGDYSLKDIITGREQAVVKMLVLNLGTDPDEVGNAIQAIRTAAIARKQDTKGVSAKTVSLESSKQGNDPHDVASRWVTNHFMYLLVNLIQMQWKTRSHSERVHAMRCLNGILAFLVPSDAPQYFPQIMATINAAIEDYSGISEATSEDQIDCLRLRLLAVQALSTYCRLVCKTNRACIGQNLTTIVVSLIPVLVESDQPYENIEFNVLHSESARLAVGFLEWLTKGKLGKYLSLYFKDIPFLPTSANLDGVRNSLKANGVDFDNLLVVSQSTQQNAPSRESHSEAGSVCSSTDGKGALSKRINTISSLLGNENVSIRRVVLEHLIDLLRANRSLFHTLCENEGRASSTRFLTVPYPDAVQGSESSGSVTKMMGILLARCVHESDQKTRRILGTCLGEIGAISDHKLGVISMSKVLGVSDSLDSSASSWRLNQPPWNSQQARYELQLVTRHLVVALKAASTSSEQHKIAFSIQQLLQLLDKTATKSTSVEAPRDRTSAKRQEMSPWLKEQLVEHEVFETVESFWYSEFDELDKFTASEPPFFQGTNTSSYYQWLSQWCKYMIIRSHTRASPWSKLFNACRTAIRTSVGLRIAEFILPVLVLDRLCFGDRNDRQVIFHELTGVFMLCNEAMNATEARKCVDTAFMVIETLQLWREAETVENQRTSKALVSPKSSNCGSIVPGMWPSDDSTFQIEELLSKIPLLLRAKAAASVGMYARALRLLEMAARQNVVDIFNATSTDAVRNSPKSKRGTSRSLGNHVLIGVDLSLMRDVLSELGDASTMAALEEGGRLSQPIQRTLDSIRQNEASGNWEGALRDYERVQQLRGHHGSDSKMQQGVLRCLLELGQFESVINQVRGISNGHASLVKPFAVEAAWRLGRWSSLSDLTQKDGIETELGQHPESRYQLAQGKAMLALHKNNLESVASAVSIGRQAVMDSLSSVARESYSRSYPYLVRLQCLRELEDTAGLLCSADRSKPEAFAELAESVSQNGWSWQQRLDLVAPSSVAAVISTRLALARLAGNAVLEGSFHLHVGRKARKNGLFNIAADSLAQAEAAFSSVRQGSCSDGVDGLLSSVSMQLAKLQHNAGESSAALKMLGEDDLVPLFDKDILTAKRIIISQEKELLGSSTARPDVPDDDALVRRFAGRVLQSTRWLVEGSLKDGAEIIRRFKLIHEIAPEMEKTHFQFAKYTDSVVQARTSALMSRSQSQSQAALADDGLLRADTIFRDKTCQENTVLAMGLYVQCLKISRKHVYQALPRLLSLWFELTSIQDVVGDNAESTYNKKQGNPKSYSGRKTAFGSSKGEASSAEALAQHAKAANKLVTDHVKDKHTAIWPFYTAMPQLIAQILHPNQDTVKLVRFILAKVLYKFPEQSMWPLAWLLNSEENKRVQAGEQIFANADKFLRNRPAKKKLLNESKALFVYLKSLACYQPTNIEKSSSRRSRNQMFIKPWRGEVALCEFVPPVQAALSICMISSDDTDSSRDLFPRDVPRMRDFSSKVDVMSSKAKPKKITAFVIPRANIAMAQRAPIQDGKKVREKGDIGEVHFLLKQEEKGDLRKDARVQDLNNVINRLMASPRRGDARQLHLRTFAVTCLSELTGMLEWVPDTASLRSLIQRTYNPQAATYSNRRRGSRAVDFGDAALRMSYEKCQEQYFKYGNLQKAAAKFEESLLKEYPPVFYWWFVHTFQDPHAWYEARTLFALSSAVWSGVGHVIGLGDRHSENILLDTTNGECVHVDFDCIFDKGLNLPMPEVVPFRLTANMLDAFGPTGADGVYTSSLKLCMRTLRDNRDTLLSVLEPFVKDPIIDWKRTRSSQSPKKKSSGNKADLTQNVDETLKFSEAKHSVRVLDERLRGIYNLRNPNHKRVKRMDGGSVDQNIQVAQLLPLSVEGQVHKMIAEATSSENLVQVYVGWMSWV